MVTETGTVKSLRVLTDALARCRSEDVRGPAVTAALAMLTRGAGESWPFDQFRHALEIDRAEDRWQTANAALNGIKRVCG